MPVSMIPTRTFFEPVSTACAAGAWIIFMSHWKSAKVSAPLAFFALAAFVAPAARSCSTASRDRCDTWRRADAPVAGGAGDRVGAAGDGGDELGSLERTVTVPMAALVSMTSPPAALAAAAAPEVVAADRARTT